MSAQTLTYLFNSACTNAVEWIGDRDAETAWRDCPRGDWLLWAAARLDVDRRLLVRAACACARTALLHLVPEGEERSRIAIETAESWARGEATIEEVHAAAAAARAAARAAYVAARTARAAADARTARAAADASAYAADAADASAYAAAAAARAASATYAAADARAVHADLVRQIIPWADVADRLA
jgi:hypothetical protein